MKSKQVVVLLYLVILFVLVISFSSAQLTFSTGVEVCDTDWYCTDWSNTTCGTRTCIDANLCGLDNNRPDEYAECPVEEEESGGGGSSGGGGGSSGGGGGGSFTGSLQQFPADTFEVSRDIVKVETTNFYPSLKSISLTSNIASDYTLGVSSNEDLNPADFVLVSEYEFYLEEGEKKELELEFNPQNLVAGVYLFIITLKNSDGEKNITVIMNVNSPQPLNDFLIELPPSSKLIDNESYIYPKITFVGLQPSEVQFTYSLLNQYREEISLFSEEIEVAKKKSVTREIAIPNNLEPGYYIFSATMVTDTDTRSRYETFLVHPESTFKRIESPLSSEVAKGQSVLNFLYFVAIVIVFVIVLMMFTLRSRIVSKNLADNKIPHDSSVKKYIDSNKKSENPLKTALESGLITQKQYDKLSKEEEPEKEIKYAPKEEKKQLKNQSKKWLKNLPISFLTIK